MSGANPWDILSLLDEEAFADVVRESQEVVDEVAIAMAREGHDTAAPWIT